MSSEGPRTDGAITQQGTTLWVDKETAKLAKECSTRQGLPVNQLVKDCLRRIESVHGTSDSLAFVVPEWSPRRAANESAGSTALGLPSVAPDDPHRLDRWLHQEQTDAVILLGRTMRGALTLYEPQWRQFLADGGKLRVLLQGPLGPPQKGAASYSPLPTPEDIEKKREDSIDVLSRLNGFASTPDSFAVRIITRGLVTGSVIILYRSSGFIDVQIQRYLFLWDEPVQRGACIVIRTTTREESYRALISEVFALWEAADWLLPGKTDSKRQG